MTELISRLAEWARIVLPKAGFTHMYVFGSAANRGGLFFNLHGKNVSDIDLILTYSDALDCALARVRALERTLPHVKELEADIRSVLGVHTDKRLFSILPVTSTELYHNINECIDQKLYLTKQFVDVLGNSDIFVSLSDRMDPDFHFQQNELMLAIKHAQATRREFLTFFPNGKRALNDLHDDDDPIPKTTMRRAALMESPSLKPDAPERTFLAYGLSYVVSLLFRKKNDDQEFWKLWEKVSFRLGRRGASLDLTCREQLLLAEMLFDEAIARLPVTLGEQLDCLLAKEAPI